MGSCPGLDVVIVTYNSAGHLAGCVASLPPGTRVIVVDNASEDASASIAEGLGCEVLRNERNEGFGAAVNRAVRERGRAPEILLLNPDARIDGPNLERLRSALADESVGVAGPRLHDPAGTEQRPWWDFPSAGHAWREALGLHRLRPPDFNSSADVPFVVGACFLIRSAAWHDVGGFDERFWLYGEEADLCRRLHDRGWRVRYVAGASAVHVGGASGDGPDDPVIRDHFVRGSDRFVLNHGGALALISYRVASVAGSTIRALALPPGDPRRARRRALARAGIRALTRHPTLVSQSPSPVPHRGLVVCSLEDWDAVWRRNQFLVRELTAADPGLRVLFVEPASDPLHDALVRHVRPDLRAGVRPVPGNPQVLRYRPLKLAPRRFGSWADRSLARQVLRAATRSEINDATLWINDLNLVLVATRLSGPVLYDMTDDWLAAGAPDRELARLSELENRLLHIAGSVVVCSPGLASTKDTTRPVVLIPNAVDVERFRTPQTRPHDLPAEPVALYVGTLHAERVDVELVLESARALPTVQFALVGPSVLPIETTRRLEAAPNIHLLGPRPYEAIPAYLQHATVIIVPHVVSAFTESLDPIKAYECLAVDRPTVATPVAGFRGLTARMTIADRSGYVDALRGVIAGKNPDSGDRAAPAPELPSWRDRAIDFEAALAKATNAPPLPFAPPLRVVYVGHTAALSGGELALLRLLPALQELGVEAHVILGEDGPLVGELRRRDIDVEVLPLAPAARNLRRDRATPTGVPIRSATQTLRYVRQLARRIRTLDPDVVHTNTLKAAVYGGAAARMAGVPVVWHIRDRIAADYLPKSSVVALQLLARVVPNAVVTNSRATRATLGSLENRAAAVPSPVAYDSVERPIDSDVRPDRPFTVGILGRLSPWKGQHVFLEAFARAFPRGSERAVVIGSALFDEHEYADSLPPLAERLGLADRVDFRGFQDDVFAALAQLDVLVHASTIPEPFGQVIIEGMAAGLPVVASAAGGPLEIITDEVDGILIPPGDVEAMARALVRLAENPQLRARLGARAFRSAARFRPERVAADVANLYRRMLPLAEIPG